MYIGPTTLLYPQTKYKTLYRAQSFQGRLFQLLPHVEPTPFKIFSNLVKSIISKIKGTTLGDMFDLRNLLAPSYSSIGH